MEAVRREVLKIDARMREMLDVSRPRVFNIQAMFVDRNREWRRFACRRPREIDQ